MGLYYMSEIVNVREKVKTVKAVEYRSTNPCFPSGKWEIRGSGASHVRTNPCRQNRVSQRVTAIKDQARRLLRQNRSLTAPSELTIAHPTSSQGPSTQHRGEVSNLVLLPDGLRFVSGGDDDKACVLYHGLAPQ